MVDFCVLLFSLYFQTSVSDLFGSSPSCPFRDSEFLPERQRHKGSQLCTTTSDSAARSPTATQTPTFVLAGCRGGRADLPVEPGLCGAQLHPLLPQVGPPLTPPTPLRSVWQAWVTCSNSSVALPRSAGQNVTSRSKLWTTKEGKPADETSQSYW